MTTLRKMDFGLHMLVFFILFLLLLTREAELLSIIFALQFLVGVYQVISSIIRTFSYHGFDNITKKLLIGYWAACAVYGTGWLLFTFADLDTSYSLPYLSSAWIIAIYYCYITYQLAHPKYTKSHLDI